MCEEDYQQEYFETLEKYIDTLHKNREYWEAAQETQHSLENALCQLEKVATILNGAGSQLKMLAEGLHNQKADPTTIAQAITVLHFMGTVLEQQPWLEKNMSQPSTELETDLLPARQEGNLLKN